MIKGGTSFLFCVYNFLFYLTLWIYSVFEFKYVKILFILFFILCLLVVLVAVGSEMLFVFDGFWFFKKRIQFIHLI
jgi:hypothetical protein